MLALFVKKPAHFLERPVAKHVVPYHDLGLWIRLAQFLAELLHILRIQSLRARFFSEKLALLTRSQIKYFVSPHMQIRQRFIFEGQQIYMLMDHAADQLERFVV